MERLKRRLQVCSRIAVWAIGITGILYTFALIIVPLMVPLWYMLLGAAVVATCLIYKKKPFILRPIILVFVITLLILYFALEFVPHGNMPGNQMVNGVAFKDIAGDYYYGDGLGVNCGMEITPDGRFFFTWSGCLGVYDRNKGGVTATADALILHPKRPNRGGGFRGTPTVLIPVKWNDRMYLIPTEKMMKFCDMINVGFEPRKNRRGLFYMRRQDWEKPCTGLPAVGASWASCLHPKQVQNEVDSSQDSQPKTTN